MGKLVSVVKHVDAREFIVRTMCVMYVSVENVKKSVVPNKISIRKLVGVIIHDDTRRCLYILHAVCNVRKCEKRAEKCNFVKTF